MMPKPNPNRRNEHNHGNEYNGRPQEKVLLESKPSFWLYSDNFILKIVVLFIMVFMFAPILTLVYTLHGELVSNFHIAVDNVMFYSELILILLILVVIIKLILDVLDWNYTNYVFTDTRIIIQRGFIRKERIMMSYNKIQDIEIRQSLLERLIRVGDIIIYGANEVSETILDDIPSPRKAEEIILERMNSFGYNQNTYINNGYQQPVYGPQYQPGGYSPQGGYYRQGGYNPQQQQGYNQQPYQQQGYTPQSNDNQGYIQVDHNQTSTNSYDEGYIQVDHGYDGNGYYDEDVIIPDRPQENRWENNNTIPSQELDKEQILRKHDAMFKKYKK